MKSFSLSFKAMLLMLTIGALFGLCGCFGKPDLDVQTRNKLKEAGVDLSQPQKLDFYLFVPTETTSRRARAALEGQGFVVEERRSGGGSTWLCVATKTMVPDLAALRQARGQIQSIAETQSGDYDHWEVHLEK